MQNTWLNPDNFLEDIIRRGAEKYLRQGSVATKGRLTSMRRTAFFFSFFDEGDFCRTAGECEGYRMRVPDMFTTSPEENFFC